MRHNVKDANSAGPGPSRDDVRNLVTALFRHERIKTTTPKAKEARAVAERLITYAKAGDLNSRRLAARKLTPIPRCCRLFAEIGPRYADRPGGYTRVLRLDGLHKGDAADVAIAELVDTKVKPKVRDTAQRKLAAAP